MLFASILAAVTAAASPELLTAALNAELLSHDSATAVLESWCGARHLAEPPKVTARLVRRADVPASPALRRELQARPGERIRYRRVQLVCGAHVLSNADNWYLPGRLTPEMNRLLDETETPFGKAVKPLEFHRRTLSVEVLARPGAVVTASSAVLRHRAVLSTPDGAPFSKVVETYTGEALAAGADSR
jgi:chorismate-pyruvate lyase